LETAAESIQAAGYKLGSNVCLAVDVAASHFVQKDGSYRLDDRYLSPEELIDLLVLWKEQLPLVSIALLLKVNQIGTVTEAKNAYLLAREAGWKVAVSARSGETEDHWLADLAVGWSGDFIKVGSITQSDRLAKYNRLLMIEDTHAVT
jgi:enolase